MADAGLRTPNIPSSSLFDDVLGNSGGQTVRVPAAALQAVFAPQLFDTLADMVAATDLGVGMTALVRVGFDQAPEAFDIVAAASYTAAGSTVLDLAGTGLQAVSWRIGFADTAEILGDTRPAAYCPEGTVLRTRGGAGYLVMAAAAVNQDLTTAGGLKLADLQARSVASMTYWAARPTGTWFWVLGLFYEVDPTAIGVDSATNDLGVDGLRVTPPDALTAIDGVPIGAVTPAAGTFTTLEATAGVTSKSVTLAGLTPTADHATGNLFELTMTGNTTIYFSNWPTAGAMQVFALKITGGASAYTLALPASFKTPSGAAIPAPGIGQTNLYTCLSSDGGSTVICIPTENFA